MLSIPQLGLPEAWKPLFRALTDAGWECIGGSEETPEWTTWPVLQFESRQEPWLGKRFLAFLDEPVWCGNVLQERGFCVAGVAFSPPTCRADAEITTIALTGDWEAELEDFVAAFSRENERERH
jgi:hypothetical protein